MLCLIWFHTGLAFEGPAGNAIIPTTFPVERARLLASFRVSRDAEALCCGWPQVGLQLIAQRGNVLACHKKMSEMVVQSEMGMSSAILEGGFNLDSLMLRYQVLLSYTGTALMKTGAALM